MIWNKGRGKLGLLNPILGHWICNKNSQDRTNPQCTRQIEKTLDGKYIQMITTWHLGDKNYIDHTLIGINPEKEICFWSFTSDGKQSHGKLTDVSDVHPEAFGFEAQMPAGIARQIFWPEGNGFNWAVESKTKKGWNRFVAQSYTQND